jgi:uncharacterized protein YbaR (Trm112 family)/ubiquinone/menaquinone biosynthesis C-methylase UbiE
MVESLEELSKLLICPDCSSSLKPVMIDSSVTAFLCSICDNVFPVKENIPILLASPARNYDLEYPLILSLCESSYNMSDEIKNAIENTKSLLLKSRDKSPTWDWEDEVYWSAVYRRRRIEQIEKNWNDRNWERELISSELVKKLSLKGKTILSVGAGEGNNFKHLLLPYCDEKTLYIAIDISFEALISNRLSNTHRNSLFILASVDYRLPIRKKEVDVLCYFGVLHHTKNKIGNMPQHIRVLRNGGFVFLAEAIHRSKCSISKLLGRKEDRSAHEGHLEMSNITTVLSEIEILKTLILYEFGTMLFTAMKYVFGRFLLRSRGLYRALLKLDMLTVKIVGKYFQFLKAGSILLLAEIAR